MDRETTIQPLWYHPTTVLLLDDDTHLLDSLVVKMHPDFSSVSFSKPKEALEYLTCNVLPLKHLSRAMISDIEPSEKKHLTTQNLAIDFSPLQAHLEEPIRFTRILVAVVDRVMPSMDGLSFCRRIKALGLPVKLILLTGQTGDKEAVAAFNDHIIHAFVEKSGDVKAMMNRVNAHIENLAFQVFCESSEKLLGPVMNHLSLLRAPKFSAFLENVLDQHRILEHYVMDASGSCLLITAQGVVKVLLIKSFDDFKDAYDIADSMSGDPEVLMALKNRCAFPFPGIGRSYLSFDPSQWKDVMMPMKKQADLNLYYGILEVSKILSFDYYINELWEPTVD